MSSIKKREATLPAADWEPFFKKAKVRVSELEACKSERSKAIRIGKFLGPMVGRVVPIQYQGRTGSAGLRLVEGRGREKRYGFFIRWDHESPSGVEQSSATLKQAATATTPTARTKLAEKPPSKALGSKGAAVKKATRRATDRVPTATGAAVLNSSKPVIIGGGNQEKW